MQLVKRPAVLDRVSSSKPSLHPLGNLKKYPNDVAADEPQRTALIVGPCFLPHHLPAVDAAVLRVHCIEERSLLGKRRIAGADEGDVVAAVAEADADAAAYNGGDGGAAESDAADFIPLPAATAPVPAPVAPSPAAAALKSSRSTEHQELKQQMQQMEAEIQRLKADNARWERACAQMKQLVQQNAASN